MVGYTRRNFMVPAPRFDSFDALNAHLEAKCLARQDETLRGHDKTIGVRLMTDLDALMGLPVAEYEACDHVSTRATSISMVRYRSSAKTVDAWDASVLNPRLISVTPAASQTRVLLGTGIIAPTLKPALQRNSAPLAPRPESAAHQTA